MDNTNDTSKLIELDLTTDTDLDPEYKSLIKYTYDDDEIELKNPPICCNIL
jgi:hypothetical protein